MNQLKWALGGVCLGGVVGFGVVGALLIGLDGNASVYKRNSTYIDECGACHLAYHPGLLPAASWRSMMGNLAEHFGESAETDQETMEEIQAYLDKYALIKGQTDRLGQLWRNMPETPPLRITELPGFVQAHKEVPEQLELEELAEGFLSPCGDCHRTAASGIFDKELIHPGYGPKVWGGDSSEDSNP